MLKSDYFLFPHAREVALCRKADCKLYLRPASSRQYPSLSSRSADKNTGERLLILGRKELRSTAE